MKSEIDHLASQQEKANMQTMLKDEENYISPDTDYRLAMCLSYYLDGRTDKLPGFNLVDDVMESNEGIVSAVYGLVVTTSTEDDGLFSVNYEEPIGKGASRIEEIGSTYHKSYIYKDCKKYKVPEDLPVFDKKRVATIQKYIAQYTNSKKQNRVL